MSERIDQTADVRAAPPVKVLEEEAYTVLSMWDESPAEEAGSYVDACCDGCPSYTTVPCQC